MLTAIEFECCPNAKNCSSPLAAAVAFLEGEVVRHLRQYILQALVIQTRQRKKKPTQKYSLKGISTLSFALKVIVRKSCRDC